MFLVSAEYKEAMRRQVRQGKSMARVYFGVFDKTAAPDASLSFSAQTPYAQAELVNDAVDIAPGYSTFEPKQFRLDGRQRLLPSNPGQYAKQGYISEVQSGDDGVFSTPPFILFTFSKKHSMVGLTLHFDDTFDLPAQFTVIAYRDGAEQGNFVIDSGITYEYTNEFLLEDVDAITIRFDRTVHPRSRARLNSVEFGIGYVYTGSSLISVSGSHTGSPVTLELPSSSLEFTLYNQDARFDVDSDTALQRFLAAGQDVTVDYAYSIDGWTQQIPGGRWRLKEWSSDGMEAVFKVNDILEPLNDTTYDKGVYDGTAHTLYDLAIDVLTDAGIGPENYYVGSYLKEVSTVAPIPRVSHAEALQLIANAGRARLFVSRDDKISFMTIVPGTPTASSTTAQTSYSDVESVIGENAVEYATFEPEFYRLSGEQLLLPGADPLPGGWVVEAQSGADLLYPENELLLTYDAPTNVFLVEIDWGGVIPAEATITAREDADWKPPVVITPRTMVERYPVEFKHINAFKISLTKAPRAGVRPRIRRVFPSMLSDFTLTKNLVFNHPKGTMGARLRNVTTYWTAYKASDTEEQIQSYDADSNSGWVVLDHDLAVDLDAAVTAGAAVVEQHHYAYVSYIKLTSAAREPVTVTLTGRKVTEVKHPITSKANDTGDDLEVENPLFASAEVAQTTADWVRDYYARRITYDDEIIGFPELEYGDTIYIDGGASAQVTDVSLEYNGAFRSNVTLRR